MGAMDRREILRQWVIQGLEKDNKSRGGLALALGRSQSVVTAMLKTPDEEDARPIRVEELAVIAGYLEESIPPLAGIATIVGTAGDAPEGDINFLGEAPMPSGGELETLAIELVGDSLLRTTTGKGGIIYFENRREAPAPDMIDHPCVVGLADGRVMIRVLQIGRSEGFYDLESYDDRTIRDAQVSWVSPLTTIILPWQAKRIMRRENGKP